MNSVVSAIPSMIFTPFLSDRKITIRGEYVCERSNKADIFPEGRYYRFTFAPRRADESGP
jgi:hypothetical protein